MGAFIGFIDLSNDPTGSGRYWRVDSDLTYLTDIGERITVWAGATTDGASVPWWADGLFPRLVDPRIAAAALIHDQLYETQGAGHFTRAECDGIFREALLTAGVAPWRAWVMWAAVRIGGGSGWNAHTPESVAYQMGYIEVSA